MVLPYNLNRFGGGKRRPYYCEVEYLEADGDQYIDTGVSPSETLSFDCMFNNPDTLAPGYGNVFGSRKGSNNQEYQLSNFNGGTVSVGTRNAGQGFQPNTINRVTFDGDHTITVNGVSKTITTSQITEVTGNIYLFAICSNGYIAQMQAGKIYYCKLGNVRDMIPVLDWNMKPAMYDRISGQLFYNKRTGNDFKVGRQIHYVEYLEGDGNQYIKTGFFPNQDTKIECYVEYDATQASGTRVLTGSRVAAYNNQFDIFLRTSNGDTRFGYGAALNTSASLSTGNHLIVKDKRENYIDGILISTQNQQTFTCVNELYVFGQNTNGTFELGTSGETHIRYYKAYDNNILVRDYLPAVDESGVGFMFDKVEHRIYDNAGTGKFVYPDVELEYLETDGDSYINTDIIFAGSDTFKIVGMRTGTSGRSMFGGRTANNVYNGLYEYNKAIYACVNNTYTKVDDVWSLDNEHDLSYTGDTLTIDGSQYTLRSVVNTVNFTSLFGLNNGGTITAISSDGSYIKSCQYIHNDTLTKDYVPVIHEGSFCLYDKVSQTYTSNAGTGTFTGKIKEKR